MRIHKCIICGKEFKAEKSFDFCPGCGSLGTTYSTEVGGI